MKFLHPNINVLLIILHIPNTLLMVSADAIFVRMIVSTIGAILISMVVVISIVVRVLVTVAAIVMGVGIVVVVVVEITIAIIAVL